jgi:hypothetical protein
MRRLSLPDGSRATLYRVAPLPVAGLTPVEVRALLRDVRPEALAWVIREPQGFSLGVEPLSEAETLTGHFRRLTVGAESALIGDFRRKSVALRVRSVQVALDDVRLNLHALVGRQEVELAPHRSTDDPACGGDGG